MHPFFTIVSAVYNGAKTLPQLLESLSAQTCRDFELIIQDGGSRDETMAVAESYRDHLPALSLTSEPDSGIYDAWNKALSRARGQWVLFLGADDRLYNENTLQATAEMLANVPDHVLFACGDLEIITGEGRVREKVIPKIEQAPLLLRQGLMPSGHPAVFHRRHIFSAQFFDSSYRIAGDYDFWCRTWTQPSQAVNLDMTATCMGAGGVSDNPFGVLTSRKEVLQIQQRYFPGERPLWRRVILYTKSYILSSVCVCCGKKYAPIVLDKLRELRGLPPVWADKSRR